MDKLDLIQEQKQLVRIGQRVVNACVGEAGNDDDTKVEIGAGLAKRLNIPSPLKLNVRRDGYTLRIGPLVGILAGYFKSEAYSFGAQDGYFRSLLANLNRLNGIGFIFTPADVNWSQKSINGFYLLKDKNQTWRRMWFPFPDVCYNRYFQDLSETGYHRSMNTLRKMGVPAFNSMVGDKWTIYQLLQAEPDIARHLPDTQRLDSSHTLTVMIKRHHGVYVKPANECKGKGISRVVQRGSHYLLQSNDIGPGQYLSGEEIYRKIRLRSSTNNLLAQQMIKVPGGPPHFDTRVLVQKDSRNMWHVTGIAARVGGGGKITTNLHTGGHAETIDRVLQKRGFNTEKVNAIKMEIERLSLRIAAIINNHTRFLGELGLDFIIDTNGKVWFLEANPKPGRRSLGLISKEMRKLALSRPMEYALYLAGF
jgi:glutathione synthase/RimK-type ligase-like ATP-grasp enzyme